MKDDLEPNAPETRDENRTAGVDAPAKTSELEARCADLEARWLRAQADYQNLRRRTQQDHETHSGVIGCHDGCHQPSLAVPEQAHPARVHLAFG